jgi:NADPH:quinone reductase-like Zn-dependent oxidoreductase
MKAIILKEYGSVNNFESADIPIPLVKKGHIRIRIKAVSFNPVDYQIRKGLPESGQVTSSILGRDFSGIVDEVHEDEREFKKGDEVFCYVSNLASSGTYTEFICVPSTIVAKKPVFLSHEQAASIPVAGITAILAIEKAKKNKSRSFFIAGGAGGVGTFVIMFAKLSGFRNIVATAGNDKSRSYLMQQLQLKEEQIINYRDSDFVKSAIEVNGEYFDVALDLVGGKMLSACCELLAIDGQLISVVDVPGKEDFEILFQKNASFHPIGANAYSLSTNPGHWKTYKYILNYISGLFDSNVLIKPPITILGSLSVGTVKKAHELLENNSVQGKLIMTCD